MPRHTPIIKVLGLFPERKSHAGPVGAASPRGGIIGAAAVPREPYLKERNIGKIAISNVVGG